ncbi:MAG TPA: hypothetical protein VFJ43_03550, partial [Bacteroidia bacterium]|nr:hypothetical protein [Bacteroidia bacterium]
MSIFRLHNLKQLILLVVLGFSVITAKASTYFWVGNGGDWMNYSQHWATTTGGSIFYSQVPGPTDDVVFDANSFTLPNQFITTETDSLVCRNMNWTGVQYNPTFGDVNSFYFTVLNVYGSMTLDPTMSWGFAGRVSFKSNNPGNTINTYDIPGFNEVRFTSASGTWNFTNDFQCANLFLDCGTIRTGNHSIAALNTIEAVSTIPVSFFCGTSLISSANTMHLNSASLNIDGDSATFSACDFNSLPSGNFRKIIIGGNYPLKVTGTNLNVDTLEVSQSQDTFNLESNTSLFTIFNCSAPAILYNTNTFQNATFYNNISTDANNTFD